MRRRVEGLQRSNFGEWIRKRASHSSLELPKEKVVDCLLSEAQKGIVAYLGKDVLLRTIFDAEPQSFTLRIEDAPNGLRDLKVGPYGYSRIVYKSWDWLVVHFSPEIEAYRTGNAIQSTASRVNEVLLWLGLVKPSKHVYWTWPLAAQECFVGIPKPIRYRNGAKRDLKLGDGRLFSECRAELEQELQKLMLVYSASKERGIDA